jgi:hypothetical protein
VSANSVSTKVADPGGAADASQVLLAHKFVLDQYHMNPDI